MLWSKTFRKMNCRLRQIFNIVSVSQLVILHFEPRGSDIQCMWYTINGMCLIIDQMPQLAMQFLQRVLFDSRLPGRSIHILNKEKLEHWHSQRGPRCSACNYDLDLWPFDPKIYRCLPFFILHLCMKYEVCRSNTVRVIALQRSVDRQTDGQTDGRTDKVITIGLPHLRWRGPN